MLNQTALLILELGGLAVAIAAIWVLLSRFNSKLDEKIGAVVEPKIEKSEEHMIQMMEEKDKTSNASIISSLNELNRKFDAHAERQNMYNKKDIETFRIVKESLIESYKYHIRQVYWRLRNTGIISEEDMSHVQKIYPKYVELGGNSDIEAKYKEMQSLWAEQTKEAVKKARAQKREV